MAKRSATTPLNQDNWDQESDKEEAGSFTNASSEEMKKRTVKKARRRIPGSATNDIDPPSQPSRQNLLSNFTGFGSSHNSGVSSNLFSFDMTPSLSTTTMNGSSTTTTQTTSSSKNTSRVTKAPIVGDFFRRLKILNETVVKWITKHVEQSPHCVLTPIFRDYEKYYTELEQKFPYLISTAPAPSSTPPSPRSSNLSPIPGCNLSVDGTLTQASDILAGHIAGGRNTSGGFGTPMETHTDELSDDIPVVVGIPSTNSIMQLKPPKIDVPKPKTPESSPKKTFSFAVAAQPTTQTNESEEEEEPPEPQVVPVEEVDSFYSKKCKLYYKHEGSYVEKGIGMLHLKMLDDKIQLVIRADTTLGNILLNIYIDPSYQMQKMKNNIMFCCIPNPPIPNVEPTLTPILIRVSTEDDAQELIDKLKSTS